MSDYIISKTYSDNPFVDDLLYYLKQIAFGSVIKNMQEADNAESEESLKRADMLIMCTEKTTPYDLFDYSVDQMLEAGVDNTTAVGIIAGAIDPSTGEPYNYADSIPTLLKEPLRQIGMRDYLDNYVEINDYYRRLCGLPNIGDYGIPIRDYEYLLPDGNIWNATYVHEIGTSGALLLEGYGVLEQIKIDYPDADYLDYMVCGITPYKARKAYEFQLLYTPTIDNDTVMDEFNRTYENNRIYVMTVFYSEAFKYNSDYYSNFMCLLIMLLTMTEMLARVQEHMITKDLLDQRCVEYLFDQYGMPYYKSIPLRYQQRICKNLNTLIRCKSCAQGMFDIVNLFGAENITIFRYFILKDRNLDPWGNFLYNELVTRTSENNTVLDHTQEEVEGIADLTIPFPFDHYLERGNVMIVWKKNADETYTRLTEDQYTVSENTLQSTALGDATGIKYDFYYDNRTSGEEDLKDTSKSLIFKLDMQKIDDNTFRYQLPYSTFLTDGNKFIIFLDGKPLSEDEYDINFTDATITVGETKSRTKKEDKYAFILYLYQKNSATEYEKIDVIANQEGQVEFAVPEPFFNYCLRGNAFFLTRNNTYIPTSSYEIHDTNQLRLNGVSIPLNDALSFNFVYSTESIYTNIEINEYVETITATERLQTEFTINPPFDDYMKTGYKLYLRINDTYIEQDWYSSYYKTVALNTKAIGINPDDKVEVVYVYGPYGEDARNIRCDNFKTAATENGQTVFTNILFPEDSFFEHNGKVVVDVYGKYLTEDLYELNEETKTLTIKDTKYAPSEGQCVNIQFISQDTSEKAIKITDNQVTVAEDGQTDFELTVPFYPYFETDQGCLVLYNNQIINPNNITINDTTMTISNTEFTVGDVLTFVYFYSNSYLIETTSKIAVDDKAIHVVDQVDDDLIIDLKPPFDDFFEHNWQYFVTDSATNTLIPEESYNITNGGLSFDEPKEILNHDDLTVTYIYINNDEFIHEEYTEDDSKDFTLKFVGVPLDDEYFVNNIIAKQNILPYDTTTLDDIFWDGVGAEDNLEVMHEVVKAQIIQKKFNYERTKYFDINYVIDIADMTFQISYFYSMLWDDVFTEKYLNVQVPAISSAKPFNLGYIFCYLTALAYLYDGIEDTIMNTPSKILYVKGFNMKADLQVLKNYVLDRKQDVDMYPIWNFIVPENQITTMEEFIRVYDTNKQVYETIVHGMKDATRYRYYEVWKKFYDSLMIWQFNLEYFRLDSTGEIAPTFTAFLQEKDSVLYNAIEKAAAIQDDSSRREYIANHISDVVYILDAYIGGYEFHHIFDRFPGVSEASLMEYIYTIINFFKSFKIALRSKGDFISFSSKDPYMNSIRPHDDMSIAVHLNKPDYIYLEEHVSSLVHTTKKDYTNIWDCISITRSTDMVEGEAVNIFITKYEHQTIYVHALGRVYTDNVVVPYNTEFNCTIEAEYGYSAGTLNIVHGIATHDVTITASGTEAQKVTINIIQSDHQTIRVTVADSSTSEATETHTESFMCNMGKYLHAYIEADYGYTPGTLSFVMGTASSDMTIYATDAVEKQVDFIITNVGAHQNLIVRIYNIAGGQYTQYTITGGDFGVLNYMAEPKIENFGTKYEAIITADPGYDTGTLVGGIPLTGTLEETHTVFSVLEENMTIYNITITQSEHQTITATIGGKAYTTDTTSTYGTTYSVSSKADIGYAAGYIRIEAPDGTQKGTTGTVTSDMHIYGDAAIKKDDVYIQIQQSDYQLITVECNGESHTASFYAPYGSEFEASIKATDENHTPGTLNITSGTATADTVIYATPATGVRCIIEIIQSAHQNITVTVNSSATYTNTFNANYGDTITVSVKGDIGWDPGDPVFAFATVTGNMTVYAEPATPGKLYITLIQSINQTIYAQINNGTALSDNIVNAIYGDTYRIYVEGDPGYTPGELKVINTDTKKDEPSYGSMTANLTASVTGDAQRQYFDITILQSDPDHQVVSVYINGVAYTDKITHVEYGTPYQVTIVPTVEGYSPGNVIGADNMSGMVTSNMTIDATPAVLKTYTINIVQVPNQTITVRVNGQDHTSTVSGIQHGTQYEISLHVNNEAQYVEGQLKVTDDFNDDASMPTSGRLTTQLTVTATPPTVRTYTINIRQSANQLITVHIN